MGEQHHLPGPRELRSRDALHLTGVAWGPFFASRRCFPTIAGSCWPHESTTMKKLLPSRSSTRSSSSSTDPHHISHHAHPGHSSTFSSTSSAEEANAAAIKGLQTRPLPVDPIEFVEQALSSIITYHPRHDPFALQDVADHHVPRFFSKDYRHRSNNQDTDLAGFLNRISGARKTIKKARVRFLRSHVDRSERQSMQKACVSLIFEIVVTPEDREEEIRLHHISIWYIKEGKIIESCSVFDAHEMNSEGPSLEQCVIS